MKKKLILFLLASSLITSITIQSVLAQNTSPFWSLAGNSNASATSKLGTVASMPLNLITNNLTRVRIDQNGNVGVGITAPVSKFQVNGFGSFGNRITATNATRALNVADDNAVIRVLRVDSSKAPAVELISRTSADGANVAYWDAYAQPGDASFRIRDRQSGTNLDRFTIAHNSGFVGIATTTPQFSLDVRNDYVFGQFKASAGYAGVIIDKSDASQNEYLIHRTAGADRWTEGTLGNDNFSLHNWVFGSNAITVDVNTNNIGFGTLSPAYRLVATDNTTNGPTAIIQNLYASTAFNDGLYIQAGNNGGTGGTYYAAFQRPDGSVIGTISQTDANSVAYNTTSDKRLKTNIRETKFGLADIKKIQVKDYNFINNKSEQTGFIAQQLYEVFPEAVAVGGEDAKKRPWMVDYGRITPLLVKAIQDLSVKDDAKEATIATLQQQVSDLEAAVKSLKSLILNGTNTAAASVSGYLKQNTPNPAANSTAISYYLPANTGRGEIRITDAKGTSIKVYNASKGTGQLNIKSGELAAGVYNYTLYANNKVIDSKQLVITR